MRYENFNGGYNELGQFFEKEFAGKVPALTFAMRYKFLESFQDENLATARGQNAEPYPAMIVTYGNFDTGSKLWVLDRLHIYHAWPMISLETYQEYLRQNGQDYFKKSGFQEYYFLETTNIAPDPTFQALVQGITPISIFNPRGDEIFRVYKKPF